jgi:hypothetical protein
MTVNQGVRMGPGYRKPLPSNEYVKIQQTKKCWKVL